MGSSGDASEDGRCTVMLCALRYAPASAGEIVTRGRLVREQSGERVASEASPCFRFSFFDLLRESVTAAGTGTGSESKSFLRFFSFFLFFSLGSVHGSTHQCQDVGRCRKV